MPIKLISILRRATPKKYGLPERPAGVYSDPNIGSSSWLCLCLDQWLCSAYCILMDGLGCMHAHSPKVDFITTILHAQLRGSYLVIA